MNQTPATARSPRTEALTTARSHIPPPSSTKSYSRRSSAGITHLIETRLAPLTNSSSKRRLVSTRLNLERRIMLDYSAICSKAVQRCQSSASSFQTRNCNRRVTLQKIQLQITIISMPVAVALEASSSDGQFFGIDAYVTRKSKYYSH